MNKKIVVPLGLFVLLGGAAFAVVGMMGKPKPVEDYTSMRGTESYFLTEEHEYPIPEILANVVDGEGAMFRGTVTLVYQLGPELKPAEMVDLLEKKKTLLRDRLTLLFSSRPRVELMNLESKQQLKKTIEREFDRLLFQDKKGRIKDVLFPLYVIQ